MKRIALWSLAVLTATTARSADLPSLVANLPPPSMNSSKSTDALEYCIGLALGDWMVPITLHGERKVLIYGAVTPDFSTGLTVLVAIVDEGQRRTIALRAHKSWDGRAEAAIRSCL